MVNLNHILYLIQKGNTLTYDRFPIDKNIGEDLYYRICELSDSDEVSIIDLQEAYKSSIPSGIKFWWQGYCFDDEDYNDVNYGVIQAPKILSANEYKYLLRKWGKEAENDWLEINEIKRADRLTKKQIEDKEETIRAEIEAKKSELKQDFLKKLHQFLPAFNYEVALQQLKIKIPDAFCSYEYKGYSNGQYFKPGKDIELSIKTNFVYGKSSYFVLKLKYKGVHILPYQTTIHYSIQNSQQQIRYFKKYPPLREEWEQIMHDTIDLFDEIRHHEKSFVEHFILNPLNGLMAQLKSINNGKDIDLEFTEKELGFNSYCFFDTGHIEDRQDFIKIIRISNTLFLLENLTELNTSGIAETTEFKKNIISYNKKILPGLNKFYKKIGAAIDNVTDEINALSKSKKTDKQAQNEIERLEEVRFNLHKMNNCLSYRKKLIESND